ncbi:cobalt-precorrin-5B (C(1))-methyltransferase [Sphaerisporangium sp. NPDC005289]|uniref:cobalt-precorrin-5B (C(1))-methyltransferase n=1 Tax=Sphaerisporangium sp. NPDC005289 TaxID=3155247 RepID=UPI0033B06498
MSTGLRYGWTTGACATAAVTAAYTALLTGTFPDPVEIVLPRGQRPSFALATEELIPAHVTPPQDGHPPQHGEAARRGGTAAPGETAERRGTAGLEEATGQHGPAAPGEATGRRGTAGLGETAGRQGTAEPRRTAGGLDARPYREARAGVVKDAGDDPDVTHGALIRAAVRRGAPGTGVTFRAGPGVGTVTKPGLPLEVGEPAINPVPREMMRAHVARVAAAHGVAGDVVVEISVDGGEELARRTWNPRLGILGGLSILGTTGVVVPYSCSAWIDSIRRGVDVARAAGHRHVAACTGSTSERVAAELYGLPEDALLDMGDFAGAVLKYLRRHPVPRLTVAGGVGKLSKLADGHLDLHSGRSQVSTEALAAMVLGAGGDEALAARVRDANTALQALTLCREAGVPLGDLIAARARATALDVLRGAPVEVDVIVIDRAGTIVGRT